MMWKNFVYAAQSWTQDSKSGQSTVDLYVIPCAWCWLKLGSGCSCLLVFSCKLIVGKLLKCQWSDLWPHIKGLADSFSCVHFIYLGMSGEVWLQKLYMTYFCLHVCPSGHYPHFCKCSSNGVLGDHKSFHLIFVWSNMSMTRTFKIATWWRPLTARHSLRAMPLRGIQTSSEDGNHSVVHVETSACYSWLVSQQTIVILAKTFWEMSLSSGEIHCKLQKLSSVVT